MMSKKSFKDNPAFQFISVPQETEIIEVEETAAKKPNEETNEEPKPAAKLKKNPIYIETKSKRVQLLMQPTLHNQLSKLAKKKKTSFNELVHKALEKYTENE